MSDYGKMSVHDLVLLASHDGAMQQHFNRKIPSDLPTIEKAICEAVIREASAGLCYAMPSHPRDADGKSTTLATTYRLLPGAYELIPKKL